MAKVVKKAVKKAVKKPVSKAKPKAKKADAYVCGVCGYRLVADTATGCAEEHVILCCGAPMKKK
jgi:rubrerythrin